MENENDTDNLIWRIHYSLLNSNPNYPQKQLWQLTNEKLDSLNSISALDEPTKIKIKINTFELLEKIVTARLVEYVNGSINVPLEEIYGDEAHIMKKIYESDFEKQDLLDIEKINNLINRILYLPAILSDKIAEKESQLIIKETENELLKIINENKPEPEKKKTVDIIKSYREACEVYKTDKPTRDMLAEISGLPPNIWKHALSKSKFLYPLSKSLEEQMNISRNEKEFWRGAKIVVEKKLANVLYREKPPKQVAESKGSKQKRIKGQLIKADSEDQFESTHQCQYCDNIISIEQELCEDCKKLFPTKS